MGEVYRALDTNLGRQVAIKILPDTFAHDPERLARFEREAKTLASLNHPNIAQIYGLEKSDGVRALVMELVEGPTLADRIAQGPIPLDEALPIARQIAEALEAAHEQGIIHRDLKPANIKLRPDGTVKVLDFGLAKALDQWLRERSTRGTSPTITSPAMMTGVGVLLGTAAYMSPEQARGKPVDRRADIWAFGCVLYEMLTGRRAFEGEDVSLTLSQILQREPALDALPGRRSCTRAANGASVLEKAAERTHARHRRRAPDAGRGVRDDGWSGDAARRDEAHWRRAVALLLTGYCWRRPRWHRRLAADARARFGPHNVVRFALPASAGIAPRGTGVGRHVLAISPQGTHLVYLADEQAAPARAGPLGRWRAHPRH